MPRLGIILLIAALFAPLARGAEFMPPAPKRHFNDYALVAQPAIAQELDRKLEQFEKETSNQIVVVTFSRMQSPSSIEDYTVRLAESWGIGRKDRDNGAVLFVFVQDRKMYIQVGYGLEGALPDALAKQIIDNEIAPRFKKGDYAGGLRAGIDAMMAATRGEYKALAGNNEGSGASWLVPLILVFAIILFLLFLRSLFSVTYTRGGRRSGWPIIFSGGPGFGGRSGGFGGGGGGGFSGGGGSFGGGGAGGSW